MSLLTKRVANSPIYRKKTNALFKNAIALTGGIATGKSTASNILRLYGYTVIDMDTISHEALEASAKEVVGVFGSGILVDSANCVGSTETTFFCHSERSEESQKKLQNRDSSQTKFAQNDNIDSAKIAESTPKINRKKLGEIVFKNRVELAKLEAILHPKIRTEVEKKAQILEAQGILYFIDIPIFFELQAKGCGYEIPRVALIYAPREVQLARMIKRDNLSVDSANVRLANQIDIEEKRHKADFVIENVGSVRELQNKIEVFLNKFVLWR